MCGIIGYKGSGIVTDELVEGLKRMEYRGYDSWGVAALTPSGVFVEKKVGAIGEGKLTLPPTDALLGIAHTRWATHGGVTQANAHPHQSSDGRFLVAQNGIVENYLELKADLERQGYQFQTPTDTEVIVHLIHAELQTADSFPEAVRRAFLKLTGRNTIIVLDRPTQSMVAVRLGSPLVLGHLRDGGVMLASDTLPLAGKADEVTYLDDSHMVVINSTTSILNVQTGAVLKPKRQRLDLVEQRIDKEGFDHFMLKEVVEQQHTIVQAVGYSESELLPLVQAIKKAQTVYTIGAGTAALAAGQIARFLRVHAAVPAQELRSYEIDSFLPLMSKKDLLLVVSQSGETADTLEAVAKARQQGVAVASIVNMIGSTLGRTADFSFLSRSGPEICVASTKAYTAQVSWGYLVAMTVAGRHAAARQQIQAVAKQLEEYFGRDPFPQFRQLAKKLKKHRHFFVIGKDQHFYTALEGALKIKEITYKHFEGFSAGELKHGVIALIEEGTPVFGVVGSDVHKAEVLNALAEVKARGAQIIGVAAESHEFFDIHLSAADGGELDAITKVIPFQLLSYFLGVELGNDPDKPRNLAKSVTVK